ncbi:MAG: hypothetical protein GY696_17350 [Gammaproteobacteria bacterium]|nr:hypothetical protein [Gammaproteobacteria bacterium]
MRYPQLTTPALDKRANPRTITHPQDLYAWLDELPYANPAAVAESLLTGLILLNRHPKKLPKLAQLMQHYLPPCQDLTARTRELSEGKGTPAVRRGEERLVELTHRINREMGYGFKRDINEKTSAGIKPKKVPELASSIYHAINCLSLELMFSFSDYHHESKHAWIEILQLYMLTERYNFLDQRIPDPQFPLGYGTIKHLFKRILLIILLDPFRLQQGEVWAAYDYLEQWGNEPKITSYTTPAKNEGHFKIPVSGKIPVSSVGPEETITNSQDYLLLNIVPLNILINQQLQMLQKDEGKSIEGVENWDPVLLIQMFRHMLLAWHLFSKRRHPRHESYDWMVAAAGIESIHHLLEHDYQEEDEMPLPSLNDPEPESVKITSSIQPETATNHNMHRWRQVDISATGAGLILPATEASTLQVGQLVLMEGEQNRVGGDGWNLGVVRRLTHTEDGNLNIGIQFVRGQLQPATIEPQRTGVTHITRPHTALLLDRDSNQTGMLFTPKMVFRHNQEYRVVTSKGEKFRVFGDRLVEASATFERFEFRTSILAESNQSTQKTR